MKDVESSNYMNITITINRNNRLFLVSSFLYSYPFSHNFIIYLLILLALLALVITAISSKYDRLALMTMAADLSKIIISLTLSHNNYINSKGKNINVYKNTSCCWV